MQRGPGRGGEHEPGDRHHRLSLPLEAFPDLAIADGLREEAVNMSIAIVVPAEKVLEVLNHPELQALRNELAAEIIAREMPSPDTAEAIEQDPPS